MMLEQVVPYDSTCMYVQLHVVTCFNGSMVSLVSHVPNYGDGSVCSMLLSSRHVHVYNCEFQNMNSLQGS